MKKTPGCCLFAFSSVEKAETCEAYIEAGNSSPKQVSPLRDSAPLRSPFGSGFAASISPIAGLTSHSAKQDEGGARGGLLQKPTRALIWKRQTAKKDFLVPVPPPNKRQEASKAIRGQRPPFLQHPALSSFLALSIRPPSPSFFPFPFSFSCHSFSIIAPFRHQSVASQ